MESCGKNEGLSDGSRDGFIAVDIADFSPKTEHIESSSSRKGFQRNGGENPGDGNREEEEKDATFVHVAQDGCATDMFRVTTPRVAGNLKRSSRRRSTWLGPRRVLFVFAALSSIGTLILLFFTLAIAKPTANQNG